MQGAILRVQLVRLEEQNRKRRENAAYLTRRLKEIGGLEPVLIDPRSEIYSVHIFMIRYNPDLFGGLPRAKLLEAVNAEGIPAFSGYTHAVYRNPMFLDKRFYGKDCPISCGFYGQPLDYRESAEKCPVSERACASEAIWLEHRLFLGTTKDMDHISEAFAKVKENIKELS
jgi:dTDP-4-amino-4,6-dideoxygalactose transaminase